MGKLTKIQAYANQIVNSIIEIDQRIAHWANAPDLHEEYNLACGARNVAVPDCIDMAERCESVRKRLGDTVMARSLLEDCQKIESACGRIARACDRFHDCVERLFSESHFEPREARRNVETDSQMDIARSGEKMLRQARKLCQEARRRTT